MQLILSASCLRDMRSAKSSPLSSTGICTQCFSVRVRSGLPGTGAAHLCAAKDAASEFTISNSPRSLYRIAPRASAGRERYLNSARDLSPPDGALGELMRIQALRLHLDAVARTLRRHVAP